MEVDPEEVSGDGGGSRATVVVVVGICTFDNNGHSDGGIFYGGEPDEPGQGEVFPEGRAVAVTVADLGGSGLGCDVDPRYLAKLGGAVFHSLLHALDDEVVVGVGKADILAAVVDGRWAMSVPDSHTCRR